MKLRTKIKCATVVTAVIAIATLCGASYWFAKQQFQSLMEAQVRAVAVAVAAGTDLAALQSITSPASAETSAYTTLAQFLRGVQDDNIESKYPLTYVYLLVPTTQGASTGFDFAVDSTQRTLASGEQNADWDGPGTPYNAHAAYGEDSTLASQRVSVRYMHDRLGEWLSGCAPIRGPGGRVVGLACVDIDHTKILRELNLWLMLAVGVSLVFSVIVYITIDGLVERFLQPLVKMGLFVHQVGEGKFGARLDVDARSEFRVISSELNAMARSLGEREVLARQNAALTIDVGRKRETLEAISDVEANLNEIQDLDGLMERILGDARKILGCDAGSVMLREGDDLVMTYVQNDGLESSPQPQQLDAIQDVRLPVNGGSIAGYAAWSGEAIVVDDAYQIPRDRPYHFNRSVDEASGYRTRAILALPLRTSAGKNVGVLQLLNPLEASGAPRVRFTEDDVQTLSHFGSAATVALERAALTRSIVMRMIRMAEMRDPTETSAHVKRVAAYSVILYEAWAHRHGVELTQLQRERDALRIAAMLHDVGKVGIADSVLKKPGRLTAEEYSIMQQHCVIGARLFADHDTVLDRACLEVSLHHHERWDGAGYPGIVDVGESSAMRDAPSGEPAPMKGDTIPIFARIVSVADVFDALSSKRQYKESWPEPRVLAEMRVNAGRQFDPELIEILFENMDKFRAVAARHV